MVEYGEIKEEFQKVPGLGKRKVTREYRGSAIGWVIIEEGAWEAAPVTRPEFVPVEEEVPVEVPLRAPPPPEPEPEELPTEVIPIIQEKVQRIVVPPTEEPTAFLPADAAPITQLASEIAETEEIKEFGPDILSGLGMLARDIEQYLPYFIVTKAGNLKFKPGILAILPAATVAAAIKVKEVVEEGFGGYEKFSIAARRGFTAETLTKQAKKEILGAAQTAITRAKGLGVIGVTAAQATLGMPIAPEKAERARAAVMEARRITSQLAAGAITFKTLQAIGGFSVSQAKKIKSSLEKIGQKKMRYVSSKVDLPKGAKVFVKSKTATIYTDPKTGQRIVVGGPKTELEKQITQHAAIKGGVDVQTYKEFVRFEEGGRIMVPKGKTVFELQKEAQRQQLVQLRRVTEKVKPPPPPITKIITKTLVSAKVEVPLEVVGVALVGVPKEEPRPLMITPPRIEPKEELLTAIPKEEVEAIPKVEPLTVPFKEAVIGEVEELKPTEELIPKPVEEIIPKPKPEVVPKPKIVPEPIVVPIAIPLVAALMAAPVLLAPAERVRRVEKPITAITPPLYQFGEVRRARRPLGPRLKARPTRYVPSFAAIALGITAKERPLALTGLEFRPIIVPEKKVKKKKKKKKRRAPTLSLATPSISRLKFQKLSAPKGKKRVKRRAKKKSKGVKI